MKRRIFFILLILSLALSSTHGQNSLENAIHIATDPVSFTYSDTRSSTSCCCNNLFYSFTLSAPMHIVISNCGSTVFDTAIKLYNESGMMVDTDSRYSGPKEDCPNSALGYLKRNNLAAGTYYIMIDWYDHTGDITTRVEGHTPESPITYPKGNTWSDPIEIGEKSNPFIYSNTQDTNNFTNDYLKGNSTYETNDVFYTLTLLEEMDITISHCQSTLTSTEIFVFNSSGKKISGYQYNLLPQVCSNIGRAYIKMNNLAPGTYYFLVEGSSFNGKITTLVEGALPTNSHVPNPIGNTMENAIDIGAKHSSFEYSDTRNTNNFTNDYMGMAANDIFYIFTLEVPMNMVITHCGSLAQQTHIHVLDETGKRLYSAQRNYNSEGCANTEHAYLEITGLPAGRYYLACEAFIQGELTTTIKGSSFKESLTHSRNYIHIITPTIATGTADTLSVNSSLQNIQYFDGLGRPVQTIQIGANPDKHDLAIYQEYDAYGRESNSWLPTISKGSGAFANLTAISSGSQAFYSDTKPYAKIVYESSPLNQVLEQYGSGADWHENEKAVRTTYLTNTSTLPCKLYTIAGNSLDIEISSSGLYGDGELFVTKLSDEDNHISYEFKDKLGQVVLSRQMDGDIAHDTYYIYDNYGNLRVVLPPMASDALTTGNWRLENTPELELFAYLYKYDSRNRCIAKKLPGADWMYYVYDKADRLIFAQDGEQRANGYWIFSIPDALGRVVLTGTCTNQINHLHNSINENVVQVVKTFTGSDYKGYTLTNDTLVGVNILTANYYDDYGFLSMPECANLNYNANAGIGYDTRSSSAKGLPTGQFVSDVNSGSIGLYSAQYYDYKGRLIQSQSNNHLGGIESEYIAYNFSGNPVRKEHIHTVNGGDTHTERFEYDYDHAQRLRKATHQLDGRTPVIIATENYDKIGRLGWDLHKSYSYNVRSWITFMYGSHSTEILHYNNSNGDNIPCYNGNISALNWGVEKGNIQAYAFEYDDLSRLKRANYYKDYSSSNRYKIPSIAYDKNGNITALERWGKTESGYGAVDNLQLTYNGNQLIRVNDSAVKVPISTSSDFMDLSNESIEYIYNRNGALAKDLNKGISNISYNLLNLPLQLDIENLQGHGRNIYTYAADGRKLSVQHLTGSSLTDTKTTDYVGNRVYENGVLKYTLFSDGYIDANNEYHFYVRDYLGNVCSVLDSNGFIIQRNDYYPFGMPFAETSNAEQDVQPYKYNGKELDRGLKLNLYDYSARQMDPALGRFTTMDPLAEKYYSISPYAYCANNPMRFVDPTGMDIWEMDTKGNIVRKKESEEHTLHALDNDGKRTGNSITISDGRIFEELAKVRDESDYKGNYVITNSFEVGNIFLFAANNTEVEWGLQGYQSKKSRQYVLRTSHDTEGTEIIDNSKEGLTMANQYFDIHSHPSPNGTKGGSGYSYLYGGDKKYITNTYYKAKEHGINPPPHYVYHKHSKTLYQFTPSISNIYIKKIDNNYGLHFIVPKR